MSLSQSLIALTVVIVTILILWYIDKEMKALRADIYGTQNLLHNIKSDIMNTQSYVPMDNGYVYASVPTSTMDKCKVNTVDSTSVCDTHGCTVEDVHDKDVNELDTALDTELDTELDTSPVEDVMEVEGGNSIEDISQPQVTKKRVYKRKKAV